MGVPAAWKQPKADQELVEMLTTVLDAARKGHVRSCLVVTVNPMLEAEHASAGVQDSVRRTILLGEMARAAHELTKDSR